MLGKFALQEFWQNVCEELLALQKFWQSFCCRIQRFGEFWQNVCSPLWPCKSSDIAHAGEICTARVLAELLLQNSALRRVLAERLQPIMALQKFWQSSCWGNLHCKSSGRALTAEFSALESFGRTFAAHNGLAKVLAELMLGKFALQEFWQSFYCRTQRFGEFWQNVCSP